MSALPTAQPLDEDLAARIAGGDDAAFDELYRRYARPLTAYAGRILRDRVAGEDVAQVSLLNAYQALRRGSRPTFVKAWLFRIARNAALETIERRGEVVPLDEGYAGGENTLDASAARADLITAVRALPDRQRNVYALRELQGLRVGEIAERLDLATEQVEQALFAARNKLAERLEFGVRIDCASVKSLAEARLTRAQRRALRSHLRSCAECRSSSRLRVGALALPLGWLRDAAAAFLGGGAAKAAAVVATAAAVSSIPVVARDAPHMSSPAKPIASEAHAPTRDEARPADNPIAARFLGSSTPLALPPRALHPDIAFVSPAIPTEVRARVTEPEPETETPPADEEPAVERTEAFASDPPGDLEPVAEDGSDEPDRPAEEPAPAEEPVPTDERPVPAANVEPEPTRAFDAEPLLGDADPAPEKATTAP